MDDSECQEWLLRTNAMEKRRRARQECDEKVESKRRITFRFGVPDYVLDRDTGVAKWDSDPYKILYRGMTEMLGDKPSRKVWRVASAELDKQIAEYLKKEVFVIDVDAE